MSTNKDVFIHVVKIQGSVKDSPGSNERIKPEGLFQSSPQTQSIIYSSFSIQRGESAIYFLSVYLPDNWHAILVGTNSHLWGKNARPHEFEGI